LVEGCTPSNHQYQGHEFDLESIPFSLAHSIFFNFTASEQHGPLLKLKTYMLSAKATSSSPRYRQEKEHEFPYLLVCAYAIHSYHPPPAPMY